ncbi:MAG: helix-turn-helix domain-containing protein [Firmicutes bacterium]|nr:helix-turn-helix domain-containing protein [Bacillota bacterium]
MELGKKIAEIREKHAITQTDLAKICNVTRQTISNWENGKSYPDLETIVLLSDTFDVSLDELLKGDRKMVKKFTKEQKQGRHAYLLVCVLVVIWYVFAFVPGFFYNALPASLIKAFNILSWILNLLVVILVILQQNKYTVSSDSKGLIDAEWFRLVVGATGFLCYLGSFIMFSRSVAFSSAFGIVGASLIWWLIFTRNPVFRDNENATADKNNSSTKLWIYASFVLIVAAFVLGIGTLMSGGEGNSHHHSMFGEDYDAYLDQDIKVPDKFDGYKLDPGAVKRAGDDISQDGQNAYRYFILKYPNNEKVEHKTKDGIEYADKGERLELRFGRTDGNWAPYFSFNMEDLEADFSKERMAAENSGGIAGIEKTEYKGAKIWVYDRIRMWDDEDHTDYSWISPNMAEWQRKSIMEYTWTEFKDAEVFCFDTETNTFFLLRYAGEDFVATRSGDDYEGWELVYERDYCMLSREKALEYIKAVIDENR